MDGLNTLALFLAVAEDRSFTGAARRLGLSRSTAGKAVARLEGRLGVALFQRTTRQVRLTGAGEILLERARSIRDEWQAAELLIAEARAEPRGRLRVTMPAIGHRLMSRHIADLLERYPKLSVDLDQDDRIAHLTLGKIDVAIRSGPLDDATHRSRSLTDFSFVFCAAPAYLDRCGTPATPKELAGHRQVRFRFPETERLQPWRLVETGDMSNSLATVVSTNMEGVLAATRSGLGIAQLPDFLAEEDVTAGLLKVLLPSITPRDRFWLVWPHHLHRTPNVRAFVDHLTQRIGASPMIRHSNLIT